MYGLYYELEYNLSVHVFQELFKVTLARGGIMSVQTLKKRISCDFLTFVNVVYCRSKYLSS